MIHLTLRYYHVKISLLHVKPFIRLDVNITCQLIPLEDFIVGLHTGLISGLIVTGTDMPSLLLPRLLIKSDLGSRAWIRIGGRLVRDSDPHSQLEQTSNHRDMDSQYATVDQLAEITDTMAYLRNAILGLGQRIDGHQAQPLPISGSTPHDSTATSPPPPSSFGPTVQQDYTVPPPPPPPLSRPTV